MVDRLRKRTDDLDSDEDDLSNDIGVQCQLHEESAPERPEPSDWNNDWNEEDVSRQVSVQEQALPSLPSNEGDEIDRLQAIIAEIQLENDNLKELNAQLFQAKQYDAKNGSEDHTERNNGEAGSMPTTRTQDPGLSVAAEVVDNDLTTAGPTHNDTTDQETQTEELTQDKLSQVNNKLRRALQTIKEKVHQAAIEHPKMFIGAGDDTLERLNHLISAVGHQAMQIEALQAETYELQT